MSAIAKPPLAPASRIPATLPASSVEEPQTPEVDETGLGEADE